MKDQLIFEFENDKKLVFTNNSDRRYGFEVEFGDLDEKYMITISREDKIDLIQFLVRSL